MSAGISTSTSQGIILAADSRQTFRNLKGNARVGSDAASKIFKISDRVGVIVTGIAFLSENGVSKSIGYFIQDFIDSNSKKMKEWSVREVAVFLQQYLEAKYDYKSVRLNTENQVRVQLKSQGASKIKFQPWQANIAGFSFLDKTDKEVQGQMGIDTITFLIAGFDKRDDYSVYIVNVPGDLVEKRNSGVKGREYGADWIGQTDVVSRIVLGFDPRIETLPFLSNLLKDSGGKVMEQLRGLEYVIQWGTMTLQDAIDFSNLVIKTTEAMQRFSDGIALNPGDIPGVGGDVDIALITGESGFRWIKQKELKIPQ